MPHLRVLLIRIISEVVQIVLHRHVGQCDALLASIGVRDVNVLLHSGRPLIQISNQFLV